MTPSYASTTTCCDWCGRGWPPDQPANHASDCPAYRKHMRSTMAAALSLLEQEYGWTEDEPDSRTWALLKDMRAIIASFDADTITHSPT